MKRTRIVAVGDIKGGVGKTTLAVNFAISLALRGQDVLLVDGDKQGTARAFTQLRAESLGAPGYTAVALHGSELRTQIRLLQSKYGQIIVDVGGRDTPSLRAALTVADILVVPVLPTSFDVWSLDPLSDLIQEAREINDQLRVVAVLNAADAQGEDNEEAAAIIREKVGFEYFPYPIVRRKASEVSPSHRSRIQILERYRKKSLGDCESPCGRAKKSDQQAERFITAAFEKSAEPEQDGTFIQT